MFELIGLAIGAFLGFLASDFLAALDPVKETIKQFLSGVREKVMQLVGSFNGNPLIAIGAVLLLVVLVFWLLSFSSAMLIGLLVGVVYSQEIGKLPFLSGIAETVKGKISTKLNRNE